MSTAIFEPGPNVEAPGAVVTLDSAAALGPSVAGAKAAALARAARSGLPVLPGWVVTTGAFAGSLPVDAELRGAWAAATDNGQRPVVVRSSSTVEDGNTSSMAGMFTSVLDVRDWPSLREAVDTVVHSAKFVTAEPAPIAVLIQPQLAPSVGGVLFGVDPVTGRTDHVVVSASEAGPAAVVGGTVDGSRYVLSRRRMVDGPEAGPLSPDALRQLRALAHRTERVFGGPQDVEWAFGPDGRLWLLQSRPVTAVGGGAATGPTLGPGPVAETFPEPLSPLEEVLPPAPPVATGPQGAVPEEPDRAAVLREALRLRARWLQELTARAAWELGERLADRGAVASAGDVRWLRMPEVAEAVATGVVPADAPARAGGRSGAPLPARFRLTADGSVAPAGQPRHGGRVCRHSRSGAGRTGTGTGAGGGRGSGRVHAGSGPPEAGAVLVVRTLDPDLAPMLPQLGGLVAETGSFLSHLAILAREFGVPTAAGVEDAVARFPAGATVVVDGTTGEVALVDGPEGDAA